MPDRTTFFKEVSAAVDFLMLQPLSSTQKYFTLAVALLVLVFTLAKFHKWGRAARAGFFSSLVVVLVSGFFLMVVFVWSWQGVGEWGLVEGQAIAAVAIILGIAFFAGVAPWTRFCFKSAYFTSVAAWILALCLTAGAVYLSQWGWSAAMAAPKETPAANAAD